MFPVRPKIPAIAITGSAGKSTTKEFVYAVLKSRWKKVIKTRKNNNLPKHTMRLAQRLTPSHQAIVLETALGRKCGKSHFRFFQPNIGVITNVGTAHYGMMGNSIKSTAKIKSRLIQYMDPNGLLLINKDNEHSSLLRTHRFKGKILTVGVTNNADYQAQDVKYLKNGMEFQVILNDSTETFFIPTFGNHNVINALFAIAIADQLNFEPAEIRKGLQSFKVHKRRLKVVSLPKDSLLIDDTYNANPESAIAATDVLLNLGSNKRKIVTLGNMLELGQYAKKGHSRVGHHLATQNINAIYTYGKLAKWISKAAVKHGFPKGNVHHFNDRQNLHNKLKKEIKPQTAFLVKGSNLSKMRLTADFLKRKSVRI